MLLAALIFLEIGPIEQPYISLLIKRDLDNIARPRVELIFEKIHCSGPYDIESHNRNSVNTCQHQTLSWLLVHYSASRPAKPFPVAAAPRIAAHVIAALFPVSLLILLEEAHAFDPLRGLPGIKLRHDQAHRAAMLRGNGFAIMRPCEKRILVEKELDGNVRGPAVIVTKGKHKLCLRLDAGDLRYLACRHAAPNVIQSRPARDAMKVRINFHCRQLHEFIQRPLLWMLDQAVHFKFPGVQIDFRRAVRVEHRPLLRARLTGRNAIRQPRVGADDYFRLIDLFRLSWIAGLIFGVVEEAV